MTAQASLRETRPSRSSHGRFRFYASPAAQSRVRRATDLLVLVPTLLALGFLVIAYPSGEFERSLESILASFPGWLDPVWDFCYSLLALWAVPRRRPGRASALCLSLTPSSASSSPTSRNDDDFVFPARNGLGPLAYWNFRDRDWVETLKLAGLNDRGIKIHDLRHACAGLLISQGLSPVDV